MFSMRRALWPFQLLFKEFYKVSDRKNALLTNAFLGTLEKL